MSDVILALDAGSSSIKFALFAAPTADRALPVLCSGAIADIGETPRVSVQDAAGQPMLDKRLQVVEAESRDHERAVGGRISADDSGVSVWVIPTDEDRMIAEHTVDLLTPQASKGPS